MKLTYDKEMWDKKCTLSQCQHEQRVYWDEKDCEVCGKDTLVKTEYANQKLDYIKKLFTRG